MAPVDLFGLMQSGASRLQCTINTHLTPSITSIASTSTTSLDQVTISPSCTFRSTFTGGPRRFKTNTLFNSIKTLSKGHFQALAIDEIVLLVVSYIDGESLARFQGVSRAWRTFFQHHHEALYQSLVYERQVFNTIITSQSAFLSYLFSTRHELDRELAHTHAVRPTHQAFEHYCTSTADHGFVAMFCDIIEFRNPNFARFVALKRQSALGMVLAATPMHVMKFRRQSNFVGPITFVPVDNPLWPVFTLPPVTAEGFVSYAFDHVTMVPGYEPLKDTVVKSILKDLMIFDTKEHIGAYERHLGRAPYATSLESDIQVPEVGHSLTFSSPLRRQLGKYRVTERIRLLHTKIKAVDACIAATLMGPQS